MNEISTKVLQAQKGGINEKEEIVSQFENMVWKLVHIYDNASVEKDDLFQVGMIGLIKAIDKFKAEKQVKFITYAYMLISGEMKDYLRSNSLIKFTRKDKITLSKIVKEKEKLYQALNREPTIKEISSSLKIPEEEIFLLMESKNNLSDEVEINRGQIIKMEDTEKVIDKVFLQEMLIKLPARKRIIIFLRFFKDMSQSEIAKKLGISQVHVSRLERDTLREINQSMDKT